MRRRRRWPWIVAGLATLLVAGWLLLRVPDIPAAELRARYGSPASRYVEVLPGLTVHVRDEGPRGAPVLVLVHGSNASVHTWEPWVARLQDRYRIVSLDLPAHGLTGPAPGGDYSSVAFARVLGAVVAERGLDRFVLAGSSMGGAVAARYAADHPQRLDGLILVGSSGQPMAHRDTPLVLRIARAPVVRDIAAQITPRWLIAESLDGAVSVKSVLSDAAIDRYWELLRYPGNRAATLDRFAQGYSSLSTADLAQINAPVLILWGREDRFIPVSSAAWFGRHLRNSRTVIYEGIGHLPMEEAPDRSAADVRRFLEGIVMAPVAASS